MKYQNIFFKTGILIVVVLMVGCQQPVVDESGTGDKSVTDIYTEDQQKVVDAFGNPDEFVISYNVEKDPRFETWKYIEIGKEFVFEAGKYVDAYNVEFGVPEDQVFMKAKIDPEDVYGLATIDDLEDELDTDATSYMNVNEDVWENAVFYDFAGVVTAATIDDKLVFVKTQSHVTPYKWDEIAAKVEGAPDDASDGYIVDSDMDNTEEEGYLFDEDYGFTLVLPEGWEDFDYVEEIDEDAGTGMISFLLPTEDTEFVADGWVFMFTITAYLDGNESDISPFEEVIGSNDAFLYTFSHMNGFPPADLEDQVKDFDKIRNSIELYDLE